MGEDLKVPYHDQPPSYGQTVQAIDTETTTTREEVINRLYREKQRLQTKLHIVDRKIELIDKYPIIKEYIKLVERD